MSTIWSFDNYKNFLSTVIKGGARGIVSRLADAAGCQRSYLSNVLRTEIHLVPDHAFGICKYLNLDPSETKYFLLLLEKDRAASSVFRRHLETEIRELRKQREDLSQRLNRKPLQNEADQMAYYSAWYYSAIHILVSIPRFQSIAAICRALELDSELVSRTLQDLQRMGLVKHSGAEWSFSSGDIHVPKDSPLVSLHHNNWRQRAILHSQARREGIHFTMVQSVSKIAAEQIKEKILQLIDQTNSIAGPSTSEELIYFGVDHFQLTPLVPR